MAGGLKGITIDIGANTSGLQQALKTINSQSKGLQTELKQVEKLLKLDPSNTELVAQKQKLLSQSLEGTKSKLDMLRQAQEKVNKAHEANAGWEQAYTPLKKSIDETKEKLKKLSLQQDDVKKQFQEGKINADQYEAFQKELEETTSQSKDLAKQLKELEKQFSDGHINDAEYRKFQRELADAEIQAKQLEQQLDDTSESTDNLGDKAEKAGNKTDKMSDDLAGAEKSLSAVNKTMLALAAAMGAVGIASASVGMDFEASMSNVKALSGATGEDLDKLSAKAKEMGAATSKSASQSADALGYMALAGWDTTEMLEGLEPILRLSEAGNFDLATASDLVTDSMSALGVKTDGLNGYLDIVAKTQSSANTSAQAMLETYIGCGGAFKNLNVPLEESASLIGILANRGIKGSEAGTSLNSVLINLTGGSSAAAGAMDELGISAWDSQGNFIGVENTLRLLEKALADCTQEQKTNFESAIGGKTQIDTLQALLGGLSEEYIDLKTTVSDCDGALIETAKTMQDNLKGKITELGSAAEGLGIVFYEKFESKASKAVETVTKKVSQFSSQLSKGELDNKLKAIGVAAGTVTTAVIAMNAAFAIKDMAGLISKVKLGTTAVQAYTTHTKLAAAAQGALNLVQSLSPIGMLTVALTAATVGLVAYNVVNRETNEELEALNQKIYEDKQAWEKLQQTQQAQMESSIAEIDYTQRMWQELQTLVDENGNVTGSKERVKYITEELNKVAPDSIQWVNEETIAYKNGADAIDNLIQKKRAEIILEAERPAYEEAITNYRGKQTEQTQLAIELSEKWQELKKIEAEMTQASIEGNYNEVNSLSYRYDQTEERYNDLEKLYGDNEATLSGYYETIGSYEQKTSDIMSNNYEKIKEINLGVGESFKTAGNSTKEELEKQVINCEVEYGIMKEKLLTGEKGITEQMVKEARDRAESAKLEFVKLGGYLPEGMADGADKKGFVLTDALSRIVRMGIDAAKKAADIHSPSRIMRDEVGMQLIAGAAVGVENSSSKLSQALKNTILNGIYVAKQSISSMMNVGNESNNPFNSLGTFQTDILKTLKEKATSYKEVGTMYMDLFKSGIDDRTKSVVESMKTMIQESTDASVEIKEKETEKLVKAQENERDKILEVLQDKYNKAGAQQKKQIKAEMNATKDKYSESIKEIQKQGKKEVSAMKENGTNAINAYKKEIEAGADEAIELVKTKVTAITEEFQKQYDQIKNQQESMQSKLSGFGDLFEIDSDTGWVRLENIQKNINALDKYEEALTKLRDKGVSDDFLSEVTSLGVEEGTKFAQKLLSLSDDQFETYTTNWETQQKRAREIAEEFYKDELKTLEENFVNELDTALSGVPTLVEGVGSDAIAGMVDGMEANKWKAVSKAREIADAVIAEMQRAFDIHSPSRVMKNFIAGNAVQGLVDGLTGGVGKVKAATNMLSNAMMIDQKAATKSNQIQQTQDNRMANAITSIIGTGLQLANQSSGGTRTMQPLVIQIGDKKFKEIVVEAYDSAKRSAGKPKVVKV